MKYRGLLHGYGGFFVTLRRRVWIEICPQFRHLAVFNVTLRRRVWIEIRRYIRLMFCSLLSLSAGECGLKFLCNPDMPFAFYVTLRRRVWIEISLFSASSIKYSKVTLRRRVWIEICHKSYFDPIPASHSPQESVD